MNIAQPEGNLNGLSLDANADALVVTAQFAAAADLSTSQNGQMLFVLGRFIAAPQKDPLQHVLGAAARNVQAQGALSEVVRLKYADVSEIVGVLANGEQIPPNDSFEPEPSIFALPTSGSGGIAQITPAATPNQQMPSLGQRITSHVAIDRRLNAVIISGTVSEIAALKAEIAALDVPLPSVMLECDVVELSETAAHDLELDFSNGPNSPIVTGGVTVQTTSDVVTGGAQAFARLNAQLFATIAKGGGRILATPRIVAQDGVPARILTGDAIPIIQSTIFPGSPPITQVSTNYIAVGVNLQIQPRITQDGFVTSHVYAEVSSVTAFVPTTQGLVPQISLRQASTSATVADGYPFVIGGLLKDEEIENTSGLPILSNLPLVGGLFRVRHSTEARTNLYVIITPHIITPGSNVIRPPVGLPTPRVPGPTPKPLNASGSVPLPGPSPTPNVHAHM